MRLGHPGQSTLVALTLVLASSAIAAPAQSPARTSLPLQQTPPQSSITTLLPITEPQYLQLVKDPFRFFQQLDLPAAQIYFLRIGNLDPPQEKSGSKSLSPSPKR